MGQERAFSISPDTNSLLESMKKTAPFSKKYSKSLWTNLTTANWTPVLPSQNCDQAPEISRTGQLAACALSLHQYTKLFAKPCIQLHLVSASFDAHQIEQVLDPEFVGLMGDGGQPSKGTV